jgi:hypothetical protein
MAFLESSLPLSLGPFINYFIIICVDTIRESGWIITTNWPISTIHLGLFGWGNGRRSKVIPSPLGKKLLNALYRSFQQKRFVLAS